MLDALSFGVEVGERLAIIGPNGAGKTTLFQLLSGMLTPSSGALTLADYVYIMSRGVMVHESEPEKLKENPDIRSRYLGV